MNGSTPKDKIVSNVLSEAEFFAKTDSPICVLMHDNPGKNTTTEALPEIIDGLRALGYEFRTLDYEFPWLLPGGDYPNDLLARTI